MTKAKKPTEKKTKYLEHQFKIETPTEKNVYLYNFNKMTMDRVFQAMELFRVLDELRQQPPKSLKDSKITIERQIERNAYSALLMKMIKQENYITFEKYDPGIVSSYDFLGELTGKDNYDKLEACKIDFFTHTGTLLKSSMKNLADTGQLLNNMTPGTIQSILDTVRKM